MDINVQSINVVQSDKCAPVFLFYIELLGFEKFIFPKSICKMYKAFSVARGKHSIIVSDDDNEAS